MLKPLGRFCVAAATELSPPGPWALDCSKGHALRASPFLVPCHLLIRKRQERVRKNVKFSDSRRFGRWAVPALPGILALTETPSDLSPPPAGITDPGYRFMCGSRQRMNQTRSPECLCRSLKVSSAIPDLSISPRPSATMRSYCSLVARVSGKSKPRLRPSSRAIPLSFAACAAEKKQLCSRFCMSSPSVSSTREAAPVCEKTFLNI